MTDLSDISQSPLSFTRTEVESYLPGGWCLLDESADESTPSTNRRGTIWTARVEDSAEVEWCVEISASDLDKHGRLGALRAAIDRVYREGLG